MLCHRLFLENETYIVDISYAQTYKSIFKDLIRYATIYWLIPLLTNFRLLSEMHTLYVFLYMFAITETSMCYF